MKLWRFKIKGRPSVGTAAVWRPRYESEARVRAHVAAVYFTTPQCVEVWPYHG